MRHIRPVPGSFREPYHHVEGAVYSPATLSNHFVGHAIDMNLVLGGDWFNSEGLGAPLPSLPSEIRAFIAQIESDAGLRWGGRFGDPAHIDDELNRRDETSYRAKYASLW